MVIRLRIVLACFLLAIFVLPVGAQEKAKIFLGASSKTLGYSSLWVA